MVAISSGSVWLLFLGLLALCSTSAFIIPTSGRPGVMMRAESSDSFVTVDRGQLVKAAAGTLALAFISPLAVPLRTVAGTLDNPGAVAALRTIIVVRDTTNQLEEQLEAGDYPADLQGLVKGLLRNYKLRENLNKALVLVPKDKQSEGNDALKSATESLYTILEVSDVPEPDQPVMNL